MIDWKWYFINLTLNTPSNNITKDDNIKYNKNTHFTKCKIKPIKSIIFGSAYTLT
jgi:hypothetical protein